uniref:NAD-dependent epimerase/dehydratase domain-containing protein n=1 Tax=Strigamia maritima TaxID=126957 RepID=T1IJ26_STRMM
MEDRDTYGAILCQKSFKLSSLLLLLINCEIYNCQLFGMQQENTVLVFGGNGFIGAEAVTQFLQNDYKVTCVNRGNWYWDSDDRIKPKVTNVRCDRNKGLNKCKEFLHQMAVMERPWDVVLDFSGYRPEVVENTLQVLENRMRLYIYISSDSVYEVSKPKVDPGLSKEEDATRPESLEEQEELNQRDMYGHRKLGCEEVITKELTKKGIYFIILRLPDVLGPRDTTNRWWFFQMWLQFYNYINKPLAIPPHTSSLNTSYVYVKDVAAVLLKMVLEKEKVKNDVYNVALESAYTLPALLEGIAGEMGINNVEFTPTGKTPSNFSFPFPSVTRGGVDISKVKMTLNWTPTPFPDVIKETVEFYKTALVKFPNERGEVIESLLSDVVPDQNRMEFLNAVKAVIRDHSFPTEETVSSEKQKTEL